MISLVVVNYHTAALAIRAVRTAREASSEPLQVVLVDNSESASEADALRDVADTLIVSETNRGYGAAINDARRVCEGSTLIVSNPDVVFAASAIDRLVEALTPETPVAGPALYWDENLTWVLPPSELHTDSERLSAALASRSASWRAARDKRRIAARIAFWRLQSVTPVAAISGAVMAIRTDAFDALGGFDERFHLYFEETDFLRRLAASGRRAVYVPEARCRHLFNQSAGHDAALASSRFVESEALYRARWNGVMGRFATRIERPITAAAAPGGLPRTLPARGLLIEASPLPTFETAAGHFAQDRELELPREVLDAYRGDVVYLRAIDPATLEVLATYARYKS